MHVPQGQGCSTWRLCVQAPWCTLRRLPCCLVQVWVLVRNAVLGGAAEH
jgi:hypothetical protein